MKNLGIFIVLFLSILVMGCATQRESIPLTKKPTLSWDEIRQLDKQEQTPASNQIAEDTIEAELAPRVNNFWAEGTNLRKALSDMKEQTGVNIIYSDDVQGTVNLEVTDLPLELALKMVLSSGGYKYRYMPKGNYYLVGRSFPDGLNFDQLTITRTIKTNRSGEDVLSQLSPYFQEFAKSSGQAITITASPDVVNRIESDIAMIDKSRRQIEISAKFVMVEWDKGSNLGMQWGDLDLAAAGLGNISNAASNVFSMDFASNLSSFLSANGYKAEVKTMAEPRVVVEDGELAELNISEEHLFLILSGGGAAYNYFTTKEVEVGIKLKVQPFLTRDEKLSLDIRPEVADIIGEREFKSNGGPTQKLPIIARRSTETKLKVENGETIAIGGLITKTEKTKKSGIPLFRSIPGLGILFGSKDTQTKETELVIFITSRVVG